MMPGTGHRRHAVADVRISIVTSRNGRLVEEIVGTGATWSGKRIDMIMTSHYRFWQSGSSVLRAGVDPSGDAAPSVREIRQETHANSRFMPTRISLTRSPSGAVRMAKQSVLRGWLMMRMRSSG